MYRAREYYDRIVRPTVQEFFADHDNPRLGMLACMALLHTVDHVYHNRIADPKKAEKAVTVFNDRQSEIGAEGVTGTGTLGYAAVHAFANASKHARLTRAKLKPGFGSKDFEVVAPAFADEMVVGESFIGDEIGGVTILWDQHQAVNLREAVEHTMRVLEVEFHELTD